MEMVIFSVVSLIIASAALVISIIAIFKDSQDSPPRNPPTNKSFFKSNGKLVRKPPVFHDDETLWAKERKEKVSRLPSDLS